MRDWITGVTAVLGVLMVLGGATILVLRALASTRDADATETTTVTPVTSSAPTRVVRAARQLPDADRLIGWGIALLVLALIAAGAISFNFSGQAGD